MTGQMTAQPERCPRCGTSAANRLTSQSIPACPNLWHQFPEQSHDSPAQPGIEDLRKAAHNDIGRVRCDSSASVTGAIDALAEYAAAAERDVQVERRRWHNDKPIDSPSACGGCGGPHPFDTSLQSVVWNRVIRTAGLPDYLCATCILAAFVRIGEGFTAEVWGEAFNGTPIEVIVNGTRANTAAEVGNENTRLRSELHQAEQNRDRLREALEEMLRYYSVPDSKSKAIMMARAALREGEK